MTARPCSTYIANIAHRAASEAAPKNCLIWLDSKGKVVRQREHSLKESYFDWDPKFIPWRAALSLPAPLAMAAEATLLEPWIALWSGKETTWPSTMAHAWSQYWPAVVVTSVLGGLLAWLYCRRQRKYGLPCSRAWLACVLLFGLPAYVGYLTHRRWPARLACPHCGRLAPRDRPVCAGCGQQFPPPPSKGIEVFA